MTAAAGYRETEVKTVTLVKGFERIELTLIAAEMDYPSDARYYSDEAQRAECAGRKLQWWEVRGQSFETSAHGLRVGNNASKSRPSLDSAREYANGWVTHLQGRGFTLVK